MNLSNLSLAEARALSLASLSSGDLVAFFNANCAEATSPVKKFADKKTAVRRCEPILAELITRLSAEEAEREEEAKKKADKKQGKKAPAAKSLGTEEEASEPAGSGKRGRKSAHEGKTLIPLSDPNPRKDGTHGHRSYALLLAAKKAGSAGLLYSDYIFQGGRVNDLAWDISHGYVEVR